MQDKKLHINLLKYLDGENISEQEKTDILRWLEENKDNKRYADLINRISREKKYFNQLKAIDLDQHLNRFRNNTGRNKLHKMQGRTNILLRIAAAILILIIASVTIYFARFRDVGRIQQVSSMQENTSVLLSDGTSIVLNKNSILNYTEKLINNKREVSLKGEAFFDVARNKKAPFVVHLKSTNIKVLGTSFNIKEIEHSEVRVYVLSGKVLFSETGNDENRIELGAGHTGIFNAKTRAFKKENFPSENFMFWKTDVLNFENQPLDTVFKKLEKSFGKTIVVEDEEILYNKLTSRCEGQQFEEILGELSILFAIDYRIKGDTVFIQKSP